MIYKIGESVVVLKATSSGADLPGKIIGKCLEHHNKGKLKVELEYAQVILYVDEKDLVDYNKYYEQVRQEFRKTMPPILGNKND